MGQITKHLILFLFLSLLATSMSFARKPAVEPVTGIAIDQYDDVAPEKATPYNFNQGKTKKLPAPKATKDVKQTTLEEMRETKTRNNQTIIVIMAILLPFAVWLGLMKGIKDMDESLPDNVVDLAKHKSNSNDDDDSNLPKAS